MSISDSAPGILPPMGVRSRRGSVASITGSSQIDKEQLAHALDAIHSSASQSETLTTFNEFASPPASSSVEPKGITGELLQNGLSGLYHRFRGAVVGGKDKSPTQPDKGDGSRDVVSIKSQITSTATSRASTLAINRESSGTSTSPLQLSSPSSRVQSPTTSSFTGPSESQSQSQKSSKAPSLSTPIMLKSSTRPTIAPTAKTAASSTIAPVNVNAFRDRERMSNVTEPSESDTTTFGQASTKTSAFGLRTSHASLEKNDKSSLEGEASDLDVSKGANGAAISNSSQSTTGIITEDRSYPANTDGTVEGKVKSPTAISGVPSPIASLKSPEVALESHSISSTKLVQESKRSSAMERITKSHLPGYLPSRASSTDRSIAETSPVSTSAHSNTCHDPSKINDVRSSIFSGRGHVPSATVNEGETDAVSAKLEQMRKQVLSKEFWMADEICKECFLCGDTFTAFRRKHHCRTCGCIFDSKCTSIISGERFGVQGSLRVCRTCLYIINRRHDSSGSDESADDTFLPTSFFQSQNAKRDPSCPGKERSGQDQSDRPTKSFDKGSVQPFATPMMAIPATRRMGESTNRRSAILEIDAPQLSRPSSARSLKSLSSGRPNSGHRRHQSKHNFLGRFRATAEERAPFHTHAGDEMRKQSKLPAFHDDNIIDPDLAQYMSDEASSGDEQMSIFAALHGGGLTSTCTETERSGFGSILGSAKKHRSRAGDKSTSGLSFTNRLVEDGGVNTSYSKPNRRRNLSTSSSNMYHSRGSPRQGKPCNSIKSFGNFGEEILDSTATAFESSATYGPSRMNRSASVRDSKASVIELNNASLHHVQRLLRQLLQDANITNISSWEKALIPILLQCTDDVNPDVRRGDSADIRHYIKLKNIPGGKPGDISYISGVVFTKNLALKSMSRNIVQPRIVIVSFPIEYQRHQQQFMSLEPVLAQEKDFLRNMVNRIASLRPHLLLVQSHISGLALQYLAEANISVAYNVKQSVIEAVSRCAQTEIISSIDMVALKPVQVGKSAAFNVKTYVHDDIPGRKKTYMYISGCPKELGCTIVLRGASISVLAKVKRITEFMVYVVYNLKLETCLMRDEFVLIPSITENGGSLSPSKQPTSQLGVTESNPRLTEFGHKSDTVADSPECPQKCQRFNSGVGDSARSCSATDVADEGSKLTEDKEIDVQHGSPELPKLVSAHESHAHHTHEDAVPEDIPMPTFYSDMVAKYETKLLSASPFVKFMQPYLLMRAREQERRLVYLKRLRDQDTFEEQTENEKAKPQRFQLIQPEMVHETVRGAPKQVTEVLHAVHDAEYDKALHNYQTQKRQWENYIQGNLNLFDPYAHQNIVVLYTVVCTVTTVPCAGPELLALAFYDEHGSPPDFDPDCTLGQYVEDLCLSADTICTSNGCERKMSEHHRTYVHGEARITVFVEKSPCKIKGLQDSVLMWSFCKFCKKETQVMPMSESTWKYSFGKYLELSFWSSGLRLRAGICPHDLHRDHLRYFGYRNVAIRIHYDPIDLLEIVVPRTRITWKVDNDLRLKNELFTKIEERWNRFMLSVKSRLKGINIDSVVQEKVDACKAQVEKLTKRAQDEHVALLRKLQEKYMESKYYEIIPMNRAIRAMQEKVAEWDAGFAEFDSNFFPSEKDIRRLAALQLKKMFMDRDVSVGSLDSIVADHASDVDDRLTCTPTGFNLQSSDAMAGEAHDVLQSVVEESTGLGKENILVEGFTQGDEKTSQPKLDQEGINQLDLAVPIQRAIDGTSQLGTVTTYISQSLSPTSSGESPTTVEERSISSPAPIESSLSEKIQQLRTVSQGSESKSTLEVSGIPRPTERVNSRRGGISIPQPISRTQSQPVVTLRRLQSSNSKPSFSRLDTKVLVPDSSDELELSKCSVAEPIKDKKLSERLGFKSHRKGGHSLIPRSVQTKKRDSRVSTLTKHFEELSREFEKERIRDKRQRAAKNNQYQAFPKTSSKPIVVVYKDVNAAVEERGPSDDDIRAIEASQSVDNIANLEDMPGLDAGTVANSIYHPPADTVTAAEETATEVETDDNQPSISQTASDDEGMGSDADQSPLDDIPGVADIGVAESSSDIDLPKHEKSSLMKMLTNFWAERSASGWTQLEYPLSATDHVFVDSDVIVREDEPSSLIAFALSSDDYVAKLETIRRQGQRFGERHDELAGQGQATLDPYEDNCDLSDVETSLLRATGTHLKYQFVAGSAKMLCKIFYAEQFDAVRRKCGVADRIVESLSRCLKWDSKGGKTKSVFLKTLDDRLVLKSLSPVETQAFLRFAPAYFNIMAQALFHELPSVIAKMLGFYQIVIKNPTSGTEIKWDVLIMENLFYDRSPTRIFDLKGSMRNRKIQSTGEQNEVLLDENMVEFIYESPLFAREHSKKLLRASVWNDTLFLARQNVMDYSLMVAVDEVRKELVVGIIDCIRTYTWDKKLESWIKDRGFAGGGRNRPTVTSPKEYKSRFREAMARYVLQAPKYIFFLLRMKINANLDSCWHQFMLQQFDHRVLKVDLQIEREADRAQARSEHASQS